MKTMNRLLLVFITTAGLLLGAPFGQVENAPPQASPYVEKPKKGIRINHVDRDADASVAWLKIRVLSDTAIEETWEVVQTLENWDQAMDLISRVETLGEDNGEIRYKLYVSPPWPLGNFDSIVRITRTGKPRMFLYRVEQGFMQGSFGKISAGETPDGGSWIFFENYGAPSARFPDWMVKIGIHLVVPSVLKDIHKRILEVTSQ